MTLSNGKLKVAQEALAPNPAKENKPRVSIIMPTYNQAHLIEASIWSVLNQDYTDYELIVINDESPDDTEQVVAQFTEPVRYIWQENQGLPGARNTGIRAARGEIIALLDGDDLYEPNFLSTLVELLDSTPGADAIYCVAQFVDMNNRQLPQRTGGSVPPEELFNALLGGNFITPMCLLAYKYCYDQVGLFDTSISKGEWDMWLQFAKRFNVISIDTVLARYRVVPQSMSSANPLPMLDAQTAVLYKHFGGKEETDTARWTPAAQAAFWQTHIGTVTEYLQAHNIEQAYDLLHKSLNAYPALTETMRVFYELSCGDQPRGYRGHFPSWNMAYNAKTLLDLLDKIFSDPRTTQPLMYRKNLAYANAYYALGLLCYGATYYPEARKFLFQAITSNLRFGLKRDLMTTLVKSLLGNKVINLFRSRQRMITS